MAITCVRCNSDRIAHVDAKCDLCLISILDKERDGYVPDDMGIGGGSVVTLVYCMECGQMMGKFPLPVSEMEKDKVKAEEPLDKGLIENLLKGI